MIITGLAKSKSDRPAFLSAKTSLVCLSLINTEIVAMKAPIGTALYNISGKASREKVKKLESPMPLLMRTCNKSLDLVNHTIASIEQMQYMKLDNSFFAI